MREEPKGGGNRRETLRLRDLPAAERPRERLAKQGPAALRDTELLAILLRNGSATWDVLEISAMLLQKAGSLRQLLKWSRHEFESLPGVGRVKALQMVAILELARRILAEEVQQQHVVLDSPDNVVSYFQPIVVGLEVEKFWVVSLNRKNRPMSWKEVTSGTASSCLVHPREVFREAIREGASAVIALHNHPSGDPAPSREDIRVTRQLREASLTIGIELLDHIVLGQKEGDPLGLGYYSFQENGLL